MIRFATIANRIASYTVGAAIFENTLARQAAMLDAMPFVDTVLTRLNSCRVRKMTTPPSL